MKLILHGERYMTISENNMLHEVDPPWGATISENNMLHEVDPPWGQMMPPPDHKKL